MAKAVRPSKMSATFCLAAQRHMSEQNNPKRLELLGYRRDLCQRADICAYFEIGNRQFRIHAFPQHSSTQAT
jgi:hypothetical protein